MVSKIVNEQITECGQRRNSPIHDAIASEKERSEKSTAKFHVIPYTWLEIVGRTVKGSQPVAP
jgi:hypothetical protein